MKHVRTLILAGALPALIAFPAFAQSSSDWADIKDPKELRALYTNKTFRGHGWVGHYRADGTGVLIVQGSAPVRRTWAVKEDGQVCVTPEGSAPNCSTFKYVTKDRRQVMVTNWPSGRSFIFTLEDGVPKF